MGQSIIAVIVTYNRLSYLKKTVQKSLEFGFDEILIVNNASTDGTKEFLEELKEKQITCLHLDKNIGGAGGFFEGLAYTREKYSSGWACLFDDDSFPEVSKEIVLQEINQIEAKNIGCIAASVLLPDGNISEMNRPGTNPFKSSRALYRAIKNGRAGFHVSNNDYLGNSKEIDTASFVGCFVKIESLCKSGILPRKDFFIYGDDVLFTYQLTQAGYKNYFSPKIKFVHDCYSYDHNSVFDSLWKVYFIYRNSLEVYKNISKAFFPLVAVRYLSIWYRRGKFYGERKEKYFKVMRIAVSDWLRGNYSRSLSEVKEFID